MNGMNDLLAATPAVAALESGCGPVASGANQDLLARLWNPRLADVRLPRLRKPADPVANRSYIARGLDIPVSAMTDLVTLTGPWDAAARFAAST